MTDSEHEYDTATVREMLQPGDLLDDLDGGARAVILGLCDDIDRLVAEQDARIAALQAQVEQNQ
jgi:hypothetical protein